jgi:TonB C terminal
MTPVGLQRNRWPIHSPAARWQGTSIGVFLTVLLHVLMLGPLVLGNLKTRAPIPNQSGAGASAMRSPSPPVMTLILFNDAVIRSPNDFSVTIASPDRLPARPLEERDDTEKERSTVADAQGDQAQRALLFGQYMGQVTARVERAWLRPRIPVETGSDVQFSCQVQVNQDEQGNVIAIILRNCNGDERWKQSLVQAIRSAAPLPAPASPAVATDSLSLTFHSPVFVIGSSEQGFEPERLAAASAY